jgi:hypothetical protein
MPIIGVNGENKLTAREDNESRVRELIQFMEIGNGHKHGLRLILLPWSHAENVTCVSYNGRG